MVVIRLARVGKKNSPAYRVVVADKQRAVKRKFIEVIGHYNPTLNPKELVIDKERAVFWMGQGAKASDTVHNLMANLGIIKKSDKINKVYGKATSKKAAKEGAKEPKAPTAESATGEVSSEEPDKEAIAEETPAEVDQEAPAEEATSEEATAEAPTSEETEEEETAE